MFTSSTTFNKMNIIIRTYLYKGNDNEHKIQLFAGNAG